MSPYPGGPASGVGPAGSQQCPGAALGGGPRQRCGARGHPQGLGDQRGRLDGAIRWEGARDFIIQLEVEKNISQLFKCQYRFYQ